MSSVSRNDLSGQLYFADLSPSDVKFDAKKSFSMGVSRLFSVDDGFVGFIAGESFVNFHRYSIRINSCGSWLQFVCVGDKLKLKKAFFCKVPACPMCQWRRALKWRGKFLSLLPQIQEKFPSHRWLFLTLTIRNCEIDDLRPTLTHLNKAYKRLSERVEFPFEGSVKAVEITRAWDCYYDGQYLGRHGTKWIVRWEWTNNLKLVVKPTTEVHPHIHVVGLVPASYFKKTYVSQRRWTELWKECLRVDYTPVLNVKAVRAKNRTTKLLPTPEEFNANPTTADESGMISAICETLKYTVKEKDLIGEYCTDERANAHWLKSVTQQLYKTRKVEYGGVLKEIGKELEAAYNDDDLVHTLNQDPEPDPEVKETIEMRWIRAIKKYVKIELPSDGD